MLNHHATMAAALAAVLALPAIATAQTGPGLPAAAAKQNAPDQSIQGRSNQDQAGQAQPRQVQYGQAQARQAQPGQIQSGAVPSNRGQATQQRVSQQQDDRQQNQGANDELVNYLAAKLMLANECQVKMGEMAAKKAESKEVKELAEMLKQGHQNLNKELKQAMPQLESVASLSSSDNRNDRAQEGAYQARRPNYDERNAAAGGDQFLSGASQQLLDITRRAADEHHRAVTETLGEKEGKDFDRCFLATEIGAHQWMLAELKAIQGIDQQQEFTRIVKDAEQKVEKHLEKAKELAKKMEKDRDSEGS